MELRGGRQVHLPGRTRHVQRLRVLHGRQQPADDGDRRYLLVAHHLQRARRAQRRHRAGAGCSADHLLRLRGSRPASPTPGLQSTSTSTDARTVRPAWCRASRRASACRPRPASTSRPRPPRAGSPAPAGSATSAAPFSTSAPASRKVGDQTEGFSAVNLIALSPVLHPGTFIGGLLAQNTFAFNPELPAYNILNARVGFLNGRWDSRLLRRQPDRRARSWPSTRSGVPWPWVGYPTKPAAELRRQHVHRLLMSSPNRLRRDLHAGSMRRRRNTGRAKSDKRPSVNEKLLAMTQKGRFPPCLGHPEGPPSALSRTLCSASLYGALPAKRGILGLDSPGPSTPPTKYPGTPP